MRRTALIAVTATLLLGGCTTSDTDGGLKADPTATAGSASPGADASEKTPAPTGPPCDDVWQVGEDLPDGYTACVAGTRQGDQDVTDCQDGGSLVVFDNVLFARTGGEIKEASAAPLQDTPEYGAAYSDCTGE